MPNRYWGSKDTDIIYKKRDSHGKKNIPRRFARKTWKKLKKHGTCNVRSGSKVGTYGRNFPNQQEGIEKSHTRVLQ